MIDRLEQRIDDSGAALPFIATILVLLLGMAAFAVDLGWIYLNTSRVQRAADAAALAGVVYLPGNTAGVTSSAVAGANANGYEVGTVDADGTPTIVGGGADALGWNPLSDNKLHVVLDTSIDTFFLKVFGFDSMSISRESTAEYIKPVPLGSPGNCIGIGQAVTGAGLPAEASDAFSLCNTFPQNFWAAMNGRATGLEHGDPYGTECGYQCSGTNPNWPGSGQNYYYHGIDVPDGTSSVDIYLYDAAFYDRTPNFAESGDEDDLSFTSSGGTNMTYDLYGPDDTPLIPSDNVTKVGPVSCTAGSPSLNVSSGTPGYLNQWVRMCRIDTSGASGIYVLRTSNSGSSIGGSNSFSILADANTGFVRVYAINSMSIFTNAPSGQATVYIAEVDPVHVGKTLELKFYDPGEGDGNASMTVLPPPGVSGHTCSWTATNDVPGGGPQSGSSCVINSTVGGVAQYNGEWITMRIQLPDPYTCGPDCFWKMDLDLNVSHDRTTWEARVIGNPVRLTPNQ